jgi:hypothetical protein
MSATTTITTANTSHASPHQLQTFPAGRKHRLVSIPEVLFGGDLVPCPITLNDR